MIFLIINLFFMLVLEILLERIKMFVVYGIFWGYKVLISKYESILFGFFLILIFSIMFWVL